MATLGVTGASSEAAGENREGERMDRFGEVTFVLWAYLLLAIPSFVVLGILFFVLKKTGLSRRMRVAIFSSASALLLSPVMLPAASIMLLPGPSFYIVADLYLESGRQYALKHLQHYPFFTVLSPLTTLGLTVLVALKLFSTQLPMTQPVA